MTEEQLEESRLEAAKEMCNCAMMTQIKAYLLYNKDGGRCGPMGEMGRDAGVMPDEKHYAGVTIKYLESALSYLKNR